MLGSAKASLTVKCWKGWGEKVEAQRIISDEYSLFYEMRWWKCFKAGTWSAAASLCVGVIRRKVERMKVSWLGAGLGIRGLLICTKVSWDLASLCCPWVKLTQSVCVCVCACMRVISRKPWPVRVRVTQRLSLSNSPGVIESNGLSSSILLGQHKG